MFKNKRDFFDLTTDEKLASNRYESRMHFMLTILILVFISCILQKENIIILITGIILQVLICITVIQNWNRLSEVHK